MAQNEEALAAGRAPDCVVAGRVDTLETASYRALLQGLHHCLEHWVELNSRSYDREVSLRWQKGLNHTCGILYKTTRGNLQRS